MRGYDYSMAGAYFITVCAKNRECIFGAVSNGEMRLGEAGRIVTEAWEGLAKHYPNIIWDMFIVMPNHVPGIIIIVGAGLKPALQLELDPSDGAGLKPATTNRNPFGPESRRP